MCHLIGQSAQDLLVMPLTDALSDHVPQVPQHGHEGKRLVVCTVETSSFINVCNEGQHFLSVRLKPTVSSQTYEFLPGGGLVALQTEQPLPCLRLLELHPLPCSLPVPLTLHPTVDERLRISWIPGTHMTTLHHITSTLLSATNFSFCVILLLLSTPSTCGHVFMMFLHSNYCIVISWY